MEDRDHQNLPESADDYVAVVDEEEEGDEDGRGFTFPALPFAAEGCIVPVYPIFGRPPSPPSPPAPETATVRLPLGRLLLEERNFRARQRDAEERPPPAPPDEEGGELEGVAPESYCLWAPGQSAPASPRVCRKSGSTGSVLRWRSISDRFVGRSHSDGKEKFVFFSAGSGAGPPNQDESRRKGDGAVSAGDRGRSYYSKGGGGAGGGGGGGAAGRRRSYLPYKQELVGLFANVSGLRRSYPPF